jgi:hypothetical protein
MGWFGDALKSVGNATADGLTGGLASGISGAISGIFGGIGAKKRLKRQVDAQKQLNEQAAKLNYEYGEKAAENAYKRQMEMYERSYQDQSYSAMRQQMEDAGLSVGLMYGSGGSGGAGGATTGAPQGETGGAEAGRADSPAAQQAAAIQQAQLGLGLVSMKKDLAMKDAQIEEINATAAKQRAEAANITEQKITEMQTRQAKVREIFERGKGQWIKNLESYFDDAFEGNEKDKLDAIDDLYGEHSIIGKRLQTRKDAAEIIKAQMGAYEAAQNGEAAAALAKLNTEKAKYVYMEALAAKIHGDAHMLEAKTNELARMFDMDMREREFWANIIGQGAQMAVDIAGKLLLGRYGAKALKGMSGTTKVEIPTVLGPDGKPVAKMIW